jgi:hypothetical protein
VAKRGAYSSLSTAQKQKFHRVMREFADGKLRSSDGKVVKDRDQALAIAFSEARRL